MQLDSPLRITEKVQPACLPPDEMIAPAGYCCDDGIAPAYKFLSCYYTGWKLLNRTDNILR